MKAGKDGLFEITDDTQMTLFTAEGLLRAWTTARHSGSVPDFTTALQRSYLGWLSTQEGPRAKEPNGTGADWLLAVEGLHERRAPGGTCLSALRDMALSGKKAADNTSKGCGGVMRAAPAGCLAVRINRSDQAGTALLAFELGRQAAALTHGHPSGHYPAGVLATVVSSILQGETIEAGIMRSLAILQGRNGSGETLADREARARGSRQAGRRGPFHSLRGDRELV
jgi:ADP-ribosylglycohydrolase